MKVFLSWSGDKSHRVALAFRDWLPSVIQSLEPYVSSEDIDKGTRWSTDIAKELSDASFGILCVTKENQFEPWLMFEAGALSKTIDKTFVSPFLFDLSRAEVKGPILQFQSTIFDRDDVAKLLSTLNRACGDSKLPDERLSRAFDVWWPRLEATLEEIKGTSEPSDVDPDEEQASQAKGILGDILYLAQQNQLLLRQSATEDLPRSVTELRDHVEQSVGGLRDDVRSLMRDSRRSDRRELIEAYETARSLVHSGMPARFSFRVLIEVFRNQAPLLYALGMDVLRSVQSSRSHDVRRRAVREFDRTLDAMMEHPTMQRYLFGPREEAIYIRDLVPQLKAQAMAMVEETR